MCNVCSPRSPQQQVFHLQERLDWNFLDHVLAGGALLKVGFLLGARKSRKSGVSWFDPGECLWGTATWLEIMKHMKHREDISMR